MTSNEHSLDQGYVEARVSSGVLLLKEEPEEECGAKEYSAGNPESPSITKRSGDKETNRDKRQNLRNEVLVEDALKPTPELTHRLLLSKARADLDGLHNTKIVPRARISS